MNKIKSLFSDIKQFFVSRLKKGEILCAVFISVIITFLLEDFGRRDILGGISFLLESPFRFLYNVLIILMTLCLAFFMKKRFFGFAIITTGWVTLGVTNFVVQTLRVLPLTSIDFANCTVDLLVTYIGFIGIGLLVAGIIAAFFLFGFIYKKIPSQRKFGAIRSCLMILVVSVSMLAMSTVGSSFEAETEEPVNINESYEAYGFAYSFTRTFVEKGIEEPEYYSEIDIHRVLRRIENTAKPSDVAPNIVMVQLESFFDIKNVGHLTFSSDPCPVFTHLKENCISGFLSVPYVGAGTVNTEFEILSGMNIDFFGFGEYPYKSILQEKSCETVASVLRSLGHTTTALHNYEGTFYDRNIVYGNLGFDRFVPVEFMSNVEHNRQGWAKDKVLLPYIQKALETSDGKDFVFGVTVQSHGNYPADIEEKRNISVFGAENEMLKAEYEYYVNEISEVDMFIGALISYLESFDEPTVLVLYGDHLPALTEIDDSDLSAGNMFTSEYVIWSNYGLSGEDKDLETYQLTSYLFELLNINEGLFFEFHDIYETSYIYDDLLEQLEYDILYGENYAKVSYEPMPMTVGFDDIEITSATVLGESLYVKGNNFTEYSVIYINGIAKNTVYISDEVLMTEDVSVEEEINVEIKQIAADGYRYN